MTTAKIHIKTSGGPLCGTIGSGAFVRMTTDSTKSNCERCRKASLCEDCGGPKGRTNTYCYRCAESMDMELAEVAEREKRAKAPI